MPDIFYLISKWWKQMLLIIVLSLLTVGVIVFLKPQKYLSVATAVPASAVSADKSKIFSENIQALYSNLGLPEDLDIMVGTGQLDTIYLAVTDQFNLYDHYKMGEKGEAARRKAAFLLKKNARVVKSDYGELKVKVWDTDKNLAPQLANALMEKIEAVHRELQSISNKITLAGLKSGLQKIKDSLYRIKNSAVLTDNIFIDTSGNSVLKNQFQKYLLLINEYQLMIDSKPPSLLVVERARTSEYPDKPRRTEVLIVTAILSILLAFSLALILEKRKMQSP